jgi:hypothetical protein
MMNSAILNNFHELCEVAIVHNSFLWDLHECSLIGFCVKDTILGTAYMNTDKCIFTIPFYFRNLNQLIMEKCSNFTLTADIIAKRLVAMGIGWDFR